jgi:hypothetical protein
MIVLYIRDTALVGIADIPLFMYEEMTKKGALNTIKGRWN